MSESNHYKTLDVSPRATQAEIKQAYRRLAKRFHPDSQQVTADHETIQRVNAAYEVLGDSQRRILYDRQLGYGGWKPSRQPSASTTRDERESGSKSKSRRKRGQVVDEEIHAWLQDVYQPVQRNLAQVLFSLQPQIDQLSADPFDDELMEEFQAYLEDCRDALIQAQRIFQSMPNPTTVAGAAAHLYYSLSQTGDGIDELERFTYCYSEHYLHVGQELFRIAAGLRQEAQAAIGEFV